jgi:predicted ATPase
MFLVGETPNLAARRFAEETGARLSHAETSRLTGEALLAIGDRSGAEASYREAIAMARQQSARLWELCAAMSLARLWRDQGRRIEARDLLAQVYNWFTEGFGTPVVQKGKGAARRLGRRLGGGSAARRPRFTGSWRGTAAGGGPWSPARTRMRA